MLCAGPLSWGQGLVQMLVLLSSMVPSSQPSCLSSALQSSWTPTRRMGRVSGQRLRPASHIAPLPELLKVTATPALTCSSRPRCPLGMELCRPFGPLPSYTGLAAAASWEASAASFSAAVPHWLSELLAGAFVSSLPVAHSVTPGMSCAGSSPPRRMCFLHATCTLQTPVHWG